MECLNDVRVCEDVATLPQSHIDLLESRRIENHPGKDLSMATSVFWRNIDVQEYNASKLASMDSEMYECEAILKFPGRCTPDITKFGTVDDTNFMKTFKFKVGARVVLITNIDVTQSLYNGSMGSILGFTSSKTGKFDCIVVSFDDPDAGEELKKKLEGEALKFAEENGCPMFLRKQRYTKKYKGRYMEASVTQFPLQLAWAFTCHKLQGTTIPPGEDLIVNGRNRMPKSMGYVMLSRCSEIENLFIHKSFDFKKHLLCNPRSLKAKQKLDERDIAPSFKDMELDIYFVNSGAKGLTAHLEDLKKDVYAMSAKYCCIAETWIQNEKDALDFSIGGYNLVDVSAGDGKGCCTYIKHNEKCSNFLSINNQHCQALTFQMDGNGPQLTVVYLKSNAPLGDMKDYFQQLFRRLPNNPKSHIIVGDFNFDAKKSNALSALFTKDMGLRQLVQRPTHREGRTIDHCYVSSNMNCQIKFINQYYSDHTSLCIKLE